MLRDLRWGGTRFEGLYTGIDIDAEMVRWCQHHFPAKRFQFICADHHSTVYNPGGRKNERYRVPLDDQSQDYVFSTSLFTHLLEEDLLNYTRESFRALKSGAVMEMTVFCLDSIGNHLGGRWTFNHRIGEARAKNPKMPEAAVAYTKDYLLSRCRQVGSARLPWSALRPRRSCPAGSDGAEHAARRTRSVKAGAGSLHLWPGPIRRSTVGGLRRTVRNAIRARSVTRRRSTRSANSTMTAPPAALILAAVSLERW